MLNIATWAASPRPSVTIARLTPRVRNAGIATIVPATDASAIPTKAAGTKLHGNGAACVAEIQLRDASGKETKAEFKMVKPDELEVKVPMASGDTIRPLRPSARKCMFLS